MSLDIVQERQQAHDYIDRLPPTPLSAIRSLLEKMRDPVAHALDQAPYDEEPLDEEDRKAVAEADRWLSFNQPLSLSKTFLASSA